MTNPPPAIQALLLLVVLPAAFFDIRQRRVPNWITLPGILVAIALNAFLFETAGLWMSLEGLGLAFLVYFPLYLLRGMGAGDVKLMGSVGAAVGWANWLGILFLTAVLGGLAGIVMIASRGRTRRTFQNVGYIFSSLAHRQAPYVGEPELDVHTNRGIGLPHAVAIACGTVGFMGVVAIWAPR